MISRVFGKTKPINYLLSFGFLLLCTALAAFRQKQMELIAPTAGLLFLCVLGVLAATALANYTALTNQLIGSNLFSVYFFGVFILLIPIAALDIQAVMAHVFLILGQYRLNQIRPFDSIKLKILDAALCVLLASLFLKWSLLYYVLIWVFVYAYSPQKARNWIVPLAAFVVFFLIVFAVLLIAGKVDFLWSHYLLSWSKTLEFNYRTAGPYLIILSGFFALSLLGFREHKKSGYGKALQMRLIGLVFVLAIFMVVLELPNGNSAYILTFYPAAVFTCRYTESIRKRWKREVFLTGILVLALGLLAANWIPQ